MYLHKCGRAGIEPESTAATDLGEGACADVLSELAAVLGFSEGALDDLTLLFAALGEAGADADDVIMVLRTATSAMLENWPVDKDSQFRMCCRRGLTAMRTRAVATHMPLTSPGVSENSGHQGICSGE